MAGDARGGSRHEAARGVEMVKVCGNCDAPFPVQQPMAHKFRCARCGLTSRKPKQRRADLGTEAAPAEAADAPRSPKRAEEKAAADAERRAAAKAEKESRKQRLREEAREREAAEDAQRRELQTLVENARAAKEENQLVENSSRRYGSVNELIFAAASDIALGLEELLGHSKSELAALWMDPLAAIEKEFAEHGTAEDKIVVDYVLHKKAGSCDVEFSNGGKMDQGQASDYELTLTQFVAHPNAKKAKLEAYHVAGLRIYSTAAYKSINTKLRKRINDKSDKYPFAMTVLAIKEAIMKLRVVALDVDGTSTGLDLYRGMRDMKAAEDFGDKGGCELAPMSTTTDLMVALEYSKSEFPFILKVRSSGFHDRGADISWLSAFPGEKEVLFPPLTYLKPTGRAEVVGQCTVVEVTPTLA